MYIITALTKYLLKILLAFLLRYRAYRTISTAKSCTFIVKCPAHSGIKLGHWPKNKVFDFLKTSLQPSSMS